MPMPKILHTFRTNARKAFDIPFAGWILSVVAFVAGTLVPAIHQRYSFDGLAVGDIAEVTYADGGTALSISLNIRVANAMKSAIALERIESNVPELSSVPLALSIQDVGVVDSKTGDVGESLPILIRGEDVAELQIKEDYKVPGDDAGQKRKAVSKAIGEMRKAMENSGFQLSIVVNGKLRRLTLKARPDALRKAVPLPLPPPPPLPNPLPRPLMPKSEGKEPHR